MRIRRQISGRRSGTLVKPTASRHSRVSRLVSGRRSTANVVPSLSMVAHEPASRIRREISAHRSSALGVARVVRQRSAALDSQRQAMLTRARSFKLAASEKPKGVGCSSAGDLWRRSGVHAV